jgi:hypothetical protein
MTIERNVKLRSKYNNQCGAIVDGLAISENNLTTQEMQNQM